MDGELVDATGWYRGGEGAGVGIAADAPDEAHFLTALMQGRLLPSAELAALRTPTAVSQNYGLGIVRTRSGCAGIVYEHGGSSYATTSTVFVSGDGKRVAVLLANGNTLVNGFTLDSRAGNAIVAAANKLYCAA